jgi:protein-L-isoaspartate(D-aspartate) O-methyltransferase
MSAPDFDQDSFDDGMASRSDLLRHLKEESGVLKSEPLEKAFSEIDRRDFVLPDYKPEAYEDYALPIGHGATISQPTTVAFMLELLDVQEGADVLDVGSGSGYTTALLGILVGEKGNVLGIDLVPELVRMARESISSYNFSHVRFEERATSGFKENVYDAILVSASAQTIPHELSELLSEGGVMVCVVGNAVLKGHKEGGEFVVDEEYPGFSFVNYTERHE